MDDFTEEAFASLGDTGPIFLKSQEAIKALLKTNGIKIKGKPIVVMGGTGARGALMCLALDTIGIQNVRLYHGGWLEWVASDRGYHLTENLESILTVAITENEQGASVAETAEAEASAAATKELPTGSAKDPDGKFWFDQEPGSTDATTAASSSSTTVTASTSTTSPLSASPVNCASTTPSTASTTTATTPNTSLDDTTSSSSSSSTGEVPAENLPFDTSADAAMATATTTTTDEEAIRNQLVSDDDDSSGLSAADAEPSSADDRQKVPPPEFGDLPFTPEQLEAFQSGLADALREEETGGDAPATDEQDAGPSGWVDNDASAQIQKLFKDVIGRDGGQIVANNKSCPNTAGGSAAEGADTFDDAGLDEESKAALEAQAINLEKLVAEGRLGDLADNSTYEEIMKMDKDELISIFGDTFKPVAGQGSSGGGAAAEAAAESMFRSMSMMDQSEASIMDSDDEEAGAAEELPMEEIDEQVLAEELPVDSNEEGVLADDLPVEEPEDQVLAEDLPVEEDELPVASPPMDDDEEETNNEKDAEVSYWQKHRQWDPRPWEKLTFENVRNECRRRRISIVGTKSAMLKRLHENKDAPIDDPITLFTGKEVKKECRELGLKVSSKTTTALRHMLWELVPPQRPNPRPFGYRDPQEDQEE